MENLLNKITSSEYEMIDTYRREYGDIDGVCTTPMVSSETFLEYWKDNKQDLCRLLGDNLIISKQFSYSKSMGAMTQELDQYFRTYQKCGREMRTGKDFWDAFYSWRIDYFPAYATWSSDTKSVDYTALGKNRVIRDNLYALTTLETLVRNTYDGPSFAIDLPNSKELKINHGCKVMRVLAKIADAFHLPGFEDFRICQSYVTNTKSLTGDLTLSIHPLDYMTMSDNECGWESCMSWKNGGCYRQGTIEMMNSPCVVVAYLSANEDMPIGYDDEWNSKKWRQLFIVNKQVILGIKAYPYQNSDITKQVMDWLKELAKTNMGWEYEQETPIKWSFGQSITEDNCTLTPQFVTDFMYNDIGALNYHYLYYNFENLKKDDYIHYSGESECVWCGGLENLREDNLLCDECNNTIYCTDCGIVLSEDEACYFNGNPYCECCCSEFATYCDSCDTIVLYEDVRTLGMYVPNPKDVNELYVLNYTINICNNCFKDTLNTLTNFKKDSVKLLIIDQSEGSKNCYINIEDVDKEQWSRFLPCNLRGLELSEVVEMLPKVARFVYTKYDKSEFDEVIKAI